VPFVHAFRQFDKPGTGGELLWVMNETSATFSHRQFEPCWSYGNVEDDAEVTSGRALQESEGCFIPWTGAWSSKKPAEGVHRTTWTRCGALQALRDIGEYACFPVPAGSTA